MHWSILQRLWSLQTNIRCVNSGSAFLHCRPTYCLPDDLFSLIFIAKQIKVLVANIVGSPCSHTTQHPPLLFSRLSFPAGDQSTPCFFVAQSLHSPNFAGTPFPSLQCSDNFWDVTLSAQRSSDIGGDAKRSFKYWSICVWWVCLGLWHFVCFLTRRLEGRGIHTWQLHFRIIFS